MSELDRAGQKRFVIKNSIPTVPELTEDVRTAIRDLEDESYIHPTSKVEILATLLRFKPASSVTTPESTDKRLADATGERLVSCVKRFGLHYAIDDEISEGLYRKVLTIAPTAEVVDELRELFKVKHKSPDDHRRLGEILGIPKTAIEAYEHRDGGALLPDGERRRDFGPELFEFDFFAPSKAHWQEEKAWLQTLVDQIRQISPEIYRQARY